MFAVSFLYGFPDLLQARMLILHRRLRVGVPQYLHERGQVPGPFKNIRRERVPATIELHRGIEPRALPYLPPLLRHSGQVHRL